MTDHAHRMRPPNPQTERARDLRKEMSNTEWRVWLRLRGKQLDGHKFRRQLPIGPYFADFACLSARLVVEVDGPEHEEESDRRKNDYLETQGFRVVRFSVDEVDESMDDVIDAIYCELESPHPAVAFGQGRPPRRAGR
jgi:very-short-patch-repair endonuclease